MNAAVRRIAVVLCFCLAGAARAEPTLRQRVGPVSAIADARAVAVLNDWLYAVQASDLNRINPYSGESSLVGSGEFGETKSMFAVGGWLYTIETDGSLYRVSAGNGVWQRVGEQGGWADAVAGTAWQFDAEEARQFNAGRRATLAPGVQVPADETGVILTAHGDGRLFATTPSNGLWLQVGQADFANTRFMFVVRQYLYTVESDGNLYRVHPATGAWQQVGAAGAWKNTTAGAVFQDRIYTADDGGGLYETNPRTGERRAVADAGFEETAFMVAAADALYTIDLDGTLYRSEVIPATSSETMPSTAAAPVATASNGGSPSNSSSAAGYVLQTAPLRRIRAVYRGEYSIADVVPSRWVITTALAPKLPSQTGVTTGMTPQAKVVRESGDEGRLLLVSNVGSTEQEWPVTITYEATLWSRRLVRRSATDTAPQAALDDAERRRNLAAAHDLDYKAAVFQEWLDHNQLRRAEAEDEIEFGRRVFAVILAQYRTRERAGNIKGLPASEYCTWKKADCKVRAIVFAAAMRSAGIPARTLAGILATNRAPDESGAIDAHMRAEFFAAGVGWVPAEFNGALADPDDPLSHFGEDPGDLLVQHIGTHVLVPRPEGGTTVSFGLDRPAASVSAKGQGTIRYRVLSWEVTTLPLPAETVAEAATTLSEPAAAPTEVVGPRSTPQPRQPNITVSRNEIAVTPLGNDRYRLVVTYSSNEGAPKTAEFEGAKDEIRGRLESYAGLPEQALQSALRGLESAGSPRTMPSPQRRAPPAPSGAQLNRSAPTAPQATTSSANLNIKPLGDERFQLDVAYRDADDRGQSRSFRGMKDEIRRDLEAATDLPSGVRDDALRLLDQAGRPRLPPPRRAAPPTGRGKP
ncbi:MAG: hypothetical protein JNL96_24575 [Planctomycetaceae bacterium]|nr:hypothetical protein [Planctomycetaceae bacterium]